VQQNEPHPIKQTMKPYKAFPGWQLRLPAAFTVRLAIARSTIGW